MLEGENLNVIRANYDVKLPDGDPLYLLIERGRTEEAGYASVVDSGLEPVTMGGYQLALPLVEDLTVGGGSGNQYYHYSVMHAGADWYYARDSKTGKFGAVDSDGEVAIAFEFDSIADCGGDADETMILVRKGNAWSFLDTAQTAEPGPDSTSGSMYRLYNSYTGEHFYTASAEERDGLVAVGWTDEGLGWVAPASGDPVYRLYNPYVAGGDHHYTLSAAERDGLVEAGWEYEGVGWMSAPASTGVPLYRQYNPYAATGTHNYTTSKAENDHLVSVGWREEGVGWYGV